MSLPERNLIYANKNIEDLCGYPRAELLHMPSSWHQLVLKEDQAISCLPLPNTPYTGVQSKEYRILHKNGSIRWVLDRATIVQEEGENRWMDGILVDITPSKENILMLKEKEQALELAIQGASLGTWDWHLYTNYVKINEYWAEMLGYTAEEIAPAYSSWEHLVHPDDKELVLAAIFNHLNGDSEAFKVENRLRHKKGHWVWVLNKGKVVERDPEGIPLRISGTHMDITDQKIADLENISLQNELKEFKTAIDASTIMSITDFKGTILYANNHFEHISQFKIEELVGKNHNIINSGYHPKAFWADMWQTISQGKVWRAEVKNRKKNGEYYWVDTFIIPLRNSEGKIKKFLSIRNDITEKKENESKLEKALEKAKDSDRLKSTFLANISHEIRTPMNAIMGFAELIDRPNMSDLKRHEFSKLILERSQDLLNVVNDILDISILEAGRISALPSLGNINDLLDDLKETYSGELTLFKNKNVSIQIAHCLSDSQLILKTDFIKLQQILVNLLNNAIKFTHQGKIELLCQFQEPAHVLFTVHDTGMGIPADKHKEIFKPFHQANESIHQQYGGSGLGLAICKRLVKLLGGKIWLKSEVGSGSTFYVLIPYQNT